MFVATVVMTVGVRVVAVVMTPQAPVVAQMKRMGAEPLTTESGISA